MKAGTTSSPICLQSSPLDMRGDDYTSIIIRACALTTHVSQVQVRFQVPGEAGNWPRCRCRYTTEYPSVLRTLYGKIQSFCRSSMIINKAECNDDNSRQGLYFFVKMFSNCYPRSIMSVPFRDTDQIHHSTDKARVKRFEQCLS